jgi:hypothetical protein
MERRGVPTVTVVSSAFEMLARAEAKGFAMADLPLLVVPHPVGSRAAGELDAWGQDLVAGCVQALTGGKPV